MISQNRRLTMKDNQTKYPQLRFKGFTDPWEKRTLGQTTTKAKSYSLSRDVERDHETGYRYIHYGDIHTGVADIVTEHTKLPNIEPANYDELRVNDLVVADASEDYQGIAEPAVVVGLPTHLVAGLHTITLRPSSASSLYLYYLLHTDSFKHFGYQMGTGLKVFGISWSNLSKFTFMIPSRPEQEMIVKLIESVDNLIAVNQRKLAKLKELKQGYLQKLFPKNGSKFPQLRFAGFADAWEQRKLSDLFIKGGSGGTPKSTNKAFYDGDIPFLGISDITKSNGFINNTEKHISSDGLNSSAAWIVSKGAISLAMYASVGKLAILNIDAATSQAFYNMIFDDYDLRDLVYQRLNKANELSEWNKLISTGTQSNLNADKVKNFQMYLPKNHDEIKLISTFFKQIDNTIARQQRKLEKLQELKKGYLQKMFC
jgi:type I restriction enzyme S subunit